MSAALPYEEPSLVSLLVLSSFLYFLNAARVLADHLLYGGVVAEIALGIIYGSPLADILPTGWEATFTVLGYIGLILVVFEGGLSSNLPMLLSNLPLSIVCALTGIGLPIAFSFALLNAAFGYRPLEAFAAGAALSSTSLGTTLAALNSITRPTSSPVKEGTVSSEHAADEATLPTGAHTPSFQPESTESNPSSLQQSRIGTVLISAAIIDDVIGLVIAAVIPALATLDSDSSQLGSGNLAWTIIRPLLSSVLIAATAPLVARFVLRPLFWFKGVGELWCAPARVDKPWGIYIFARVGSGWGTEAHADAVKLFLMLGTVSAIAAISYYTGTSILYGAYIAGLILTYVGQPPHSLQRRSSTDLHEDMRDYAHRAEALSFEAAFARVVGPVQNYILLPLFFASIGFAVPFLDLWRPTIIWRGFVYSILMFLAKLAVGLPILLHGPLSHHVPIILARVSRCVVLLCSHAMATVSVFPRRLRPQWTRSSRSLHRSESPTALPPSINDKVPVRISTPPAPTPPQEEELPPRRPSQARPTPSASTPAAVFMGVAMVARGEIGLLIAQLARGNEGSGAPGLLSTEPFLLCIWAILVCTLVGPVSLGFIVKRWGARVNAGAWA
ncbi:hypothetical protein C8Q78DRAFT_36827 [Trametes maxima]|nr:hypothetical protein C8Q78DRAFT_36827 [Trametes maxima]